jgi:hypothetical protein
MKIENLYIYHPIIQRYIVWRSKNIVKQNQEWN